MKMSWHFVIVTLFFHFYRYSCSWKSRLGKKYCLKFLGWRALFQVGTEYWHWSNLSAWWGVKQKWCLPGYSRLSWWKIENCFGQGNPSGVEKRWSLPNSLFCHWTKRQGSSTRRNHNQVDLGHSTWHWRGLWHYRKYAIQRFNEKNERKSNVQGRFLEHSICRHFSREKMSI